MSEKISRTILSIILAVFGIIVIVFTVIQGTGTEYAQKQIDKLLTSGFDKTAWVRMSELDGEFIDELAKQPEVLAVGDISNFEISGMPELIEIQNSLTGESNKVLKTVAISPGILNMCKISLQSGQLETEFPDEKTNFLYLGAGFENIPVGTVYKTERSNYIVAGIFKKSQRFLKPGLNHEFDQNRSDYTFNCDHSVITVVPYTFTDGIWLNAAENYTLEQSLNKAFEIAEKHGIEIHYRTLRKSYEDAMSFVLAVKNIFSKLMPVVCVSCVIMILCMQLSDIFGGLRGFGIMYSQGFSQADIEIIMVLKNVITFVISLIISVLPVYWLVNFWYNSSKDGAAVIPKILLGYAAPAAIITIIGISAVSTVFSVFVFRKYSPVEMIGGHND